MSLRHLIVDILLWAGVALELMSCLGLVVMRSAYDRVHFSGPATLGLVLVALSVLVDKSFSLIGNKAILIAVMALLGSPLLTHAIGRATRILERGDWRLDGSEDIEVEER